MTSAVDMAPPPIDVRLMGVTLAQVRAILVWLMFASSFYVAVEPAPSDLLFLVVLACFLGSGLAISATVLPFVVFLLLYNLGGFISFLQVADDEKARMFVITSFYMAFSAIFLAFFEFAELYAVTRAIMRQRIAALPVAGIIAGR